MSQFKIARQKPIKGGREPLPSCVIKDIQRCVEHEAIKYRVSKSWVIATIVADFFGIEEQISYVPQSKVVPRKLHRVK